ncbi:hypothetical protein DIZ27_44940 [Streptomyces sp. NWU339]|nr:hypothetical protein DIZ27_44940 [Streptomyces sp. NWU339]
MRPVQRLPVPGPKTGRRKRTAHTGSAPDRPAREPAGVFPALRASRGGRRLRTVAPQAPPHHRVRAPPAAAPGRWRRRSRPGRRPGPRCPGGGRRTGGAPRSGGAPSRPVGGQTRRPSRFSGLLCPGCQTAANAGIPQN